MPVTRAVDVTAATLVRGSAQLTDGWVELVGSPEEYQPLPEEHGETVFEFAGIQDPAGVLAFADRYGLLTCGPGAEEFREPLSVWWKYRDAVHQIMRMYAVSQGALKGDDDALGELRQTWKPQFEAAWNQPLDDDDAIVYAACRAIVWGINDGLRGVQEAITTSRNKPGYFAFAVYPPALLGLIYHELAMLITHRHETRYCQNPDCGRVYRVTDKRQRYCSKECAQHVRYRRWADRRKAVSS